VILISWRIEKLQPATALNAVRGLCRRPRADAVVDLLTIPERRITRVFFISAASFGGLSLYGYTTQRDLSRSVRS